MSFLVLISEASPMGAETVLIKRNTDKPQPGQSCLSQSRPRQLSVHRLKPLLKFLCIWGESKISLWMAHKDLPLLCVFCLLLGLIWWWSVAGQLLKSKRFTEKSVFLASLKTRSSVNTGFTFPSGTFCQSWGAANSTEQVPNPPATLPPSLSSPS